MPARLISSRVFCGGDVDAGFVEDVEAGVERYRLAGAGRAGDQHHAVGTADGIEQRGFLLGLVAERFDPKVADVGSDTHDDFSPYIVGSVLTRKSMARVFDSTNFIRPSGDVFSAIFRREMTLMRGDFSLMASGGVATSRRMPSTRKRIR